MQPDLRLLLNLTLRVLASNALNKGLGRQVELRNLTYDYRILDNADK